MADFAAARQHMVDSQIRTNKVTDPGLLSALAEMPRERFLARHLREIAYIDEYLAIGGGRYLMEPMVLARMIQALDLDEPGLDEAIGLELAQPRRQDAGCDAGVDPQLLEAFRAPQQVPTKTSVHLSPRKSRHSSTKAWVASMRS